MTDKPPLDGLRLLVVEDEALVAMVLEDYLADLGCTVVGPASTIGDALAFVQAEPLAFDGAILDVNLGRDPIDPVADALTERGVPFILATGDGGAAAGRFKAPILSKPFQFDALERIVRTTFVPAISAIPGKN